MPPRRKQPDGNDGTPRWNLAHTLARSKDPQNQNTTLRWEHVPAFPSVRSTCTVCPEAPKSAQNAPSAGYEHFVLRALFFGGFALDSVQLVCLTSGRFRRFRRFRRVLAHLRQMAPFLIFFWGAKMCKNVRKKLTHEARAPVGYCWPFLALLGPSWSLAVPTERGYFKIKPQYEKDAAPAKANAAAWHD